MEFVSTFQKFVSSRIPDVSKKKFFIILFAIIFTLITVKEFEKNINLVLSNSINHKVFWIDKHFTVNDIKLGTYITFRIPKNAQFYPNVKVTKIDMCDSESILTSKYYPRLNTVYYYCNSQYLGQSVPYAYLHKKISLKHFIFNGRIPQNEFFAMGNNPLSYDSRYWGLVNKSDVLFISKPIL